MVSDCSASRTALVTIDTGKFCAGTSNSLTDRVADSMVRHRFFNAIPAASLNTGSTAAVVAARPAT